MPYSLFLPRFHDTEFVPPGGASVAEFILFHVPCGDGFLASSAFAFHAGPTDAYALRVEFPVGMVEDRAQAVDGVSEHTAAHDLLFPGPADCVEIVQLDGGNAPAVLTRCAAGARRSGGGSVPDPRGRDHRPW